MICFSIITEIFFNIEERMVVNDMNSLEVIEGLFERYVEPPMKEIN